MEMINKQVRGRGRPRKQPLLEEKKVQDIVLNNKVLRIHLNRLNLEKVKSRRGRHKATLGIGKHFLGKRHSNSGLLSSTRGIVRKRNSSSIDLSSKTHSNRDFKGNTPKETPKKALGRTGVKTKEETPSKVVSKSKFKIKLTPPKAKKLKSMKVSKKSIYLPKFNYESKFKSVKPGQRFYLKYAPSNPVEAGRLGYDFHSLVADVKTLQLPGPTWKIKVIIKHNRIAALIFTNKREPERSISFNSESDKYEIILDNMPILLLGSPEKVSSSTDIEVLLDIIENIDTNNPMILYK